MFIIIMLSQLDAHSSYSLIFIEKNQIFSFILFLLTLNLNLTKWTIPVNSEMLKLKFQRVSSTKEFIIVCNTSG